MKTYTTLLVFFLSITLSFAQEFKFGSLTPEDIALKKNDLDSFSNAAVLNEYGEAYMVYNDANGKTELVFRHHVRIKIFNSDGYDQASITIPLYDDESSRDNEVLTELQAITHNVTNGRIETMAVDKSQIFRERAHKYRVNHNFTFPNLRDGSIIEYSYRVISPHIFNFRTWNLQGDIPKVNSQFQATIPAIYNYNVILRGPYQLTTEEAKAQRRCFRIAGKDIDCSRMNYGMKNIPAFVEEDYMTAASNFKSAIYFELSDIRRLNGTQVKVTKEWKDVDRELINHSNFGRQIKRGNVFKSILPDILKDASNDLDKAQALYTYLQKNIRWNNYVGKYTENNIKNALDKRSGNVADINLALIAGLTEIGLDAKAVILSTRNNGVVNNIHPVLSDFNYVIAKLNIGDDSYLLDASDPLLPFGLLPLQCINGQARVIDLKKPSYWIEPAASQKSRKHFTFKGKLSPEGVLTGTIETYTYGYAAYRKRKQIKEYHSTDAYITHINEQMPGIEILEGEIEGTDSLENALIESYQIEMKEHKKIDGSQFFFNPFFINRIKKNPFNLDERTYPVDIGSTLEEKVQIIIELPANFEIKSKPDDMRMSIENNGGRYFTETQILNDNTFLFSQLLTLNQAIFPAESYLALKEFYSRIIQQEKIDVVLSKLD